MSMQELPTESAGRFCSTTIPTVSAKRIGECGTLPGSKNMSPVAVLATVARWTETFVDVDILVFSIVHDFE